MNNQLQLADIKSASIDQLKNELAKSLTLTASHLKYLATIWNELKNRGIDLSDLKSGISYYLQEIASNQLDASLVVKYAGQKMLLHSLSKLSIDKQQELANDGFIKIIKLDDQNNASEVNTPLHALTATDLSLVFNENKIRSIDEQVLFLSKHQYKKRQKKIKTARRIMISDGKVIVGQFKVELSKLIPALSEYYKINLQELISSSHNAQLEQAADDARNGIVYRHELIED